MGTLGKHQFLSLVTYATQVRDIAGVIGRRLNVPVVALPVEEAGEHFGFLGLIFSTDCPASSTLTQQRLGWHPVQPALLVDLDQDYYFNH